MEKEKKAKDSKKIKKHPPQPNGQEPKKTPSLEEQLAEAEKKYTYLYADFENFRKRMAKERMDLVRFGWESVARDFLLVVDNMERALSHTDPGQHQALVQGLNMVMGQFKQTFENQGVKAVEAVGQRFDPTLHEAVGKESSDQPEGQVLREEMRGYTLHGRLLRPARVVVSSGSAEAPEKPKEKG